MLHLNKASNTRFRWLATIPLLLALCVLFSVTAQATPKFRVTSSQSLSWTVSGSQTITVQHTSTDSETVSCYFGLTTTKFTLNTQTLSWAPGDTTLRTVTVTFASTANDTSRSAVVFHDSPVTAADTVWLYGYDSNYIVPFTKDFWLYDHSAYLNSSSDSVAALVYNYQKTSISMTVTLTDSNWWADPTSFTISGSYPSNRYVWLHYRPHGQQTDSVYVIFSCSSPYAQTDTFVVYWGDTGILRHQYIPTVRGPNFGFVQFGDSACGNVTISNTTTQTIKITSIVTSANSDWSTSGLPWTPLWIQPDSQVTYTICYHPHNFYGQSGATINIGWQDSSGTTGTTYDYAYGHTIECMSPGSDSVVLDDVLLGGYVEATATFVMNKDSLLTAPYIQSSDSANMLIEILSPTLPYLVHRGDTVAIRIRVKPASSGDYYGFIELSEGSNCWGAIYLNGMATSVGDTGLTLFPDQRELLAFTTGSQVTVDTFWFENNYPGEVHITNATLAQGTHFSILGEIPHGLPDTIKAGQKLGVIVQFSGDTVGFYHDSLTIEASQNLQSFPVYNLEAVYTKASAGVASASHSGPALMTISPNPAVGPVQIAIANATHSSVEVFDLLGDRVWSSTNTLNCVWTPNAQSDGIYIVRASGTDSDGHPFTLSKRLILGR